MSIGIPDLWPDAVTLKDVVSPVMILRHQAGLLRGRSQNVLAADVKSHLEDTSVTHEFWLMVPALGRKTFSLFEVQHEIEFVYPAGVRFGPLTQESFKLCDSQEAFTQLLAEVFRNHRTVSVIQSLLAKANEQAATHN